MASTVQRATRGRPRRLSSERILETALELADREGLEGLSMRRLAEDLGVGTMTLYGYFRGKDELLDALVDAQVRRSEFLAGPFDGHWRTELRRLILGLRASLADHRWEVELRLRRPIVSPGAMRLTDAALGILDRAGFSTADAARGFRTLFLYTFGFSGFGDPDEPDRVRRETIAQIAALPPEDYPALSAALGELAGPMAGEEQFEFGLDLILDGLEARLA